MCGVAAALAGLVRNVVNATADVGERFDPRRALAMGKSQDVHGSCLAMGKTFISHGHTVNKGR